MSTTVSRRTASVTLYQGDDFERLTELRRAADAARHRSDEAEKHGLRRAGDDAADPELAAAADQAEAEYDAFVDEAAERAIEIRFRALQGKAFRALMAAHPPRDDNETDAEFDVNTATFPDELLVLSIEEPRHTPDERREFVDDLADGDHERFWQAAYWMNRLPGGDPKATRFSSASQSSSVT